MEAAVEIKNLTKRYGQAVVIRPLNLVVPKGGVFGLLGPNGAGKTTLIKLIAGLSKPTGGEIFLFGENAAERTPALKRRIGLIPQDSNLDREFDVEETFYVYGLLFGVSNLKARAEEIIRRFELEEMRKKSVRNLSGGMMRRVLIARSLIPDPELILLDEPTVGLDPDVRQSIWNIIAALKAAGKTLIFTTHYMEEAERLCDRIAIFCQGELALNSAKRELQEQIGTGSENLEKFFIELTRGRSL